MKRITCIVLSFLFLIGVFSLTSSAETVDSGTCGDGLTWTLDDTGTLTIGGYGVMDDYLVRLYVPVNGEVYYPWYDYRENINTVVISSGITRIGNQAFCDCSALTSVSISDTVTDIGVGAFANCAVLPEIIIPNSVTVIEDSAFAYDPALAAVTLSTQLTEFGEGVFSYCESLESVGEIPSGVTVLPWRLFENCSSLSEVTLPSSLISIKNSVFYYCTSLESISFPATLTEIGIGAFMGSGLTNVTIPGTLTSLGGKAFANSALENVTLEYGLTAIPEGLFSGCGYLQDPEIPSSVKTIGNSAFQYCNAFKNVVIPEGVETIGENAFDCNSIETVSFPESLKSIGNNAFRGKLRNIYIPSGVESIGLNAFGGFYITEYTVADNNLYYSSDDGILYNKDMTTLIKYPLLKSSGVSSFTVPAGVEQIGEYAFSDCYFGGVVLPDSLTEIGNAAFYNCDSIRSIAVPDGVTTIGDKAFTPCDILSSIRLPASLTSIGAQAFKNSPTLTSIDFDGARCQWARVTIGANNTELTNAALTVKSEHVPSQQETELTPATCTAEGEREITVTCSVCDELISSTTETIPMAQHVLIQHGGKAPTVTEPGWEPYETCANCDYTTYREIPMLTPDPYETLTFSFTDGILSVTGTGSIPTAEDMYNTPFVDFAEDCKVIVIADGIEAVNNNAFVGLDNVEMLIMDGPIHLESGAFSANSAIATVICSDAVQTAADTFSADTAIAFYEPKSAPHTGKLPGNVDVIRYSFADGTLTFDGRVTMDTYGLLDLMAVMCNYFDSIRFVSFLSYTSLDVPFYVYNKTEGTYVPAENNTLEGVKFSVKITGDKDWQTITFNEFCVLADTNELGRFRLVADIVTGEDVQDNDFEIKEEEPQESFIKRVLKWITTLLNKLFSVFSKL